MALSTIQNNSFADTAVHGRRNLIINGAMEVAQRGTSFSAPNGTYTLDRMRCAQANAADTISQQSFTAGQTDVPGSPKKYLRFAFGAATANRVLETRIEDVYTGSGQSITLSFYAKASAAHTSTIEMTQYFGSGGSSAVAFGTQSYNITTSWQRFEFTLSCPSISGKTIGAGNYLSAAFIRSLSAGPSINVDIALLQLELGSDATPFEHRSYGEELWLSQRYYYRIVNDTANPGSDNAHICMGLVYNGLFYGVYGLKQDMRTYPSMSATTDGFSVFDGANGGPTCTVDELYAPSPQQVRFRTTNPGALTNGNPAWLNFKTASAVIELSAEL